MLRRTLADPARLLILAQGLIGGALILTRYGHLEPGALVLVTAAAVLTVVGARQTAGSPGAGNEEVRIGDARKLLTGIVSVYLLYGLVYELATDRRPAHIALVVVCAALLTMDLRARNGSRARIAVAVVCFVISGAIQIRGEDAMDIDVWVMQQEAAAALQRGEDPYTISYTNVTGRLDWYPAGMADLQRVYIFPYPPQTLLADAPAYALGRDVRYTTLVATAVAALALARLAPATIGLQAVLAILVQPVTMHTIRKGWTEPVLLAATLLLLLAIRRVRSTSPHGWVSVGLAAGVVAGAKQYAPILLVPLLAAIPRRDRARSVLLAVALALAVVAPFAFWDAHGVWRSVILFHAHQMFRTDALSWTAAAVALGLGHIPWTVGVAVMLGVLVITWPRRGTLAEAAGCGPAAFLAGLLLTNAFGNYYWGTSGLVLATAMLKLREVRFAR